jgi:hypothetical protein
MNITEINGKMTVMDSKMLEDLIIKLLNYVRPPELSQELKSDLKAFNETF